ncbi:MAG: N-acetylmuramoyl-L-alanine amidase [Pseudanabaenaceae cyanobacterium]
MRKFDWRWPGVIILAIALHHGQPSWAQAPTNARLLRVSPQADGIILQVVGNPRISITRTEPPERIVIDLEELEVTPEIRNTAIPFHRLGVTQIRIGQNAPTVGRVVLDLNPSDPLFNNEWQAFSAGAGTVLLRPMETTIAADKAQVQGIALSSGGMVIQSDRPINYRLYQQGSTYIVDIGGAGISDNFLRPRLPADNPIQRIRLDEIGDTVRITVELDSGWLAREGARQPHQVNLELSRAGDMPIVADRGRGLIIIDPGHGGRDPGAVANGIREKDVVLAISLRLGRILQGMGYAVQYTRTTDVEIDLEPRVQFAERLRGDVFISVHANSLASLNPAISGLETYHAPGSSAGFSLASLVHAQVLAATGARDRGVRSARFYVIRRTTMPSILIETGFVTNPQEAANLNDPAYQERLAQGIARGIDQFLRTQRR